MLADRLARLSPEQRAAFEQRLKERRGGRSAAGGEAILPRPRGGPLPLSFAQQRLWLADRMEPGSPAYNLPTAVRLRGALDPAALAAALTAVARRHETLRTVFVAGSDGEPAQVVGEPAPVPLPLLDLSGLGGAAEDEALRLLHAEEARPFDLARGPLLRALLFRLGPDEHALVVNLHHIAGDGWSLGILVRETAALYAGAALPALPVQYADFALWQRERLTPERLDAEVAVWRERLRGLPPRLELPADRPLPARRTSRGGSIPVALGRELTAALRDRAREQGATLFMVLLAAFAALLARLSGQDDFAVGTAVAGRDRAEIEGLIGFFVNTLALRAGLADDPPFRDLLARLREVALEAYAHQEVPFDKLVEELAPERSLAHAPLVQVMIALQQEPARELRAPGLALLPWAVERRSTKFDLTLLLVETEDEVAGSLEHSRDLFDEATARRLAACFGVLAAAAAADPLQQISALPLLGAAERWQLLGEWNDTTAPAEERTLGELFAAAAARSPDAPAVIAGGEAWTFRRLDQESDRLARSLQRLGVGPESLVAVCLERSPDLLAALLAVLKAGGAWLPLDPGFPPERLGLFLATAGARTAVARGALAAALSGAPSRGPVQVLDLDAAREESDGETAGALGEEGERPPVSPESLAYVIYTSGSTGRPKGVMVPHRGLTNYLVWALEAYRSPVRGGTLAHTSIAVDLTVTSLFLPLLGGEPVVMVPDEAGMEGLAAALCARPRLSFLKMTPSHARLLPAQIDAPVLAERAGILILGGEALAAEDLAPWREHDPRALVCNEYGPTETVVGCCLYAAAAGALPAGPVPIGRPITGTRIHLLDRGLEPVPPGVPGELWVGGAGVARGYLGQPDATAERFRPDPFGAAGERLYRTGDLARRRPDGVLEYLGRGDDQIKVRGFRVEPGEVEAALARHPAVRQAAVALRGEGPAARLAAWIVPAHSAPPPDAAALRGFLGRLLPESLVPATFGVLPALPLTPFGKVDRRALLALAPDAAGAEAAGPGAPRDPVEESLAAIWAEVLEVPPPGVHDDFFALGGHSLPAARVLARVRGALGVELPLRDLFEAPTVAGLAERVRRALSGGAGAAEAPPIAPAPSGERVRAPLSAAQQRLWFLDQLAPGLPLYNIPAAVRIRGPLDRAALAAAFSGVAARHEVLRSVFTSEAGAVVQVVQPPAPLPLPLADLIALPAERRDEEALRSAVEEARRPFDLAAGPLVRVTLLRLGDGDHALLWTMHHIVSDGWSMEVFLRELLALYEAARAGRPSPLPPLPLQYADFSLWQRRWITGGGLDGPLAAWREHLSGAPPVLELPADRPRPAEQSFRGAGAAVPLEPELALAVRELGRREGVTLFMTFAAALAALLWQRSGESDLLLGCNVAGRSRGEVEHLIGLFVNLLVLRLDLSGAPTLRELLARVRAESLWAFSHQEVPFDQLVAEVRPGRTLGHTPLVQVVLNMQSTQRARALPTVPGVEVGGLGLGDQTSPFDLELNLSDDGAGIRASWLYNTELLEPATVAGLSRDLRLCLVLLTERPEAQLSELAAELAEKGRQEREERSKDFKQARGRMLAELRRKGGSAAQVERGTR